MITLFAVVGVLLLAMIGSAIINPQDKPKAEDRVRMMEAIATSVF